MKFAGYKNILSVLVICTIVIGLSSCGGDQNTGRTIVSSNIVYVRADSSLRPTLLDIAKSFSYVTSQTIKFDFTISSEMLNHSPDDSVDVYVFGNGHSIPEGRAAGIIDSAEQITLAYAIPCLIVPRFNPYLITTLSDLVNEPKLKIGVADTLTDLLGSFSLELFEFNGILDDLRDRLVFIGPTAMQLVLEVARANVDAAVAWTISTNWNPESFEVLLFASNEIPRVATISAIRAAAPLDSSNADRLMTYLNSDRCREIFRNWGYPISASEVVMYAPSAEKGGTPEY